MRPLFQRIPEIELEEGPRAAAIADEATIDGWDPLLHILASMDPIVTREPKHYYQGALAMDRYYRWYATHVLYQIRLGDWVG